MMRIGVDPGLRGGIAVLDDEGRILALASMPVVGNALDAGALALLLRDWAPEATLALERGQAYPKQGVTSAFKFGRGCGIVEGVAAALGIPLVLVTPATWQREMHRGVEGALDAKRRSLLAAKRLWPGESLLASARSRVPHDGLADALLIARWLLERRPPVRSSVVDGG